MTTYIIISLVAIGLLVGTNMLMFRFAYKKCAADIIRELDSSSEEWRLAKELRFNKWMDERGYKNRESHTDGGVKEYIIEDRYDAAKTLTTLTECADKYGSVSVADYYDIIKAPCDFKDNNYGWRRDDIAKVKIVQVRGGYIIKFPPVEVL